MGKVNIPEEGKFLLKIGAAIFFLTLLIFWGALMINPDVSQLNTSFYESFSIVTHASTPDGVQSYGILFLSAAGVVINFYIIYVMFEFILEGKMNKIFRGVKNMGVLRNLKNHYVVCGGGRVGLNVAKELSEHKKKVIIIEKDPTLFERIENSHIPLLKGDALDEANLRKVNLEKAKFLIACLDNDGDNILLTLTAKEINQDIQIGARAMDDLIVKKLYHAGAEYVVLPEVVGGVQLAKSVLKD